MPNPPVTVTRDSGSAQAAPPVLLWPVLDNPAPLPSRSVLVLAAVLCRGHAREREIQGWLSEEERTRASRFHGARLRHRFVVSRGVLRQALAICTGSRPEALQFDYGPRGKPFLPAHPDLQFNLTHSGDLMLLALSTAGEVGVDIEALRPLKDAQAIARRFFTRREADWLKAHPREERDAAFFRMWARKESVLKAAGEGIAVGLNKVEVVAADGAFHTTVTFQQSASTHWRLHEVSPADGFDGIVATPMQVREIERRTWVV